MNWAGTQDDQKSFNFVFVITYTRNSKPQMDLFIATLNEVHEMLCEYEDLIDDMDNREPVNRDASDLERVRDLNNKVAIMVDSFTQAQKEVNDMMKALKTHDSEGEPVAHLVQQPAGGEALSDSSSSEEDDLETESSSEEEVRIGDRDGFGVTFWQKKSKKH
jgi:hypothetical protein